MPLSLLAKYQTQAGQSFYNWRGFAMGADASVKLYAAGEKEAASLTKKCLAEILRLEKIFSLYEPDSAICKLNREGKLNNPPPEFVSLMQQAKNFSEITHGAFDVSVQPLWESKDFAQAKRLVDYKKIKVSDEQISFANPGMAITLNGIAQGYITDKVTELLRKNGVEKVLVNMGEMRALGQHADGKKWQVGIQNPQQSEEIIKAIEVDNMAIATSGNYGARKNHLFDPATGKIVANYQSVSVIAKTATEADALSTAFYIMPYGLAAEVAEKNGVRAVFVTNDGRVLG